MMKYKMLVIKGECGPDYKKRVYPVTRCEMSELRFTNTFVIRESVDGIKIRKSVEDGKHYMVVE